MKRAALLLFLCFGMRSLSLTAAEPQNPSPMVEHTRAHSRLEKRVPEGRRLELSTGTLFVPKALDSLTKMPLLVFLHGGDWIPEIAAEKAGMAVLRWQANGGYGERFAMPGAFSAWIDEAALQANVTWSGIVASGWSAGCGGLRQVLRHPEDAKRLDTVIMIDGIHAPYTQGKPGPAESDLETTKLNGIVAFAREAVAGRKGLIVLHTEIFPGTFASTTETADWLLRQIELPRRAVLEWGPMGSQQLSEARAGRFLLKSYAGNSAPDHVDLLHALPEILSWLSEQ